MTKIITEEAKAAYNGLKMAAKIAVVVGMIVEGAKRLTN